MMLPLSIDRAMRARSTTVRVAWLALVAGSLVALAATLSRGAWLALVAAAVALLALRPLAAARDEKGKALRPSPTLGRALGVAAAVAAVAGAFLVARPGLGRSLATRVREIASIRAPSTQSRLQIWGAGLRMAADHPVLGVGLDAFAVVFPAYRTADYWRTEWGGTPTKAHNEALHIVATQGAVGGIAALLVILRAARGAWRTVRRGPTATRRPAVPAPAVPASPGRWRPRGGPPGSSHRTGATGSAWERSKRSAHGLRGRLRRRRKPAAPWARRSAGIRRMRKSSIAPDTSWSSSADTPTPAPWRCARHHSIRTSASPWVCSGRSRSSSDAMRTASTRCAWRSTAIGGTRSSLASRRGAIWPPACSRSGATGRRGTRPAKPYDSTPGTRAQRTTWRWPNALSRPHGISRRAGLRAGLPRSEGDRELGRHQRRPYVLFGRPFGLELGALVDQLGPRVSVEAVADAELVAGDVRVPGAPSTSRVGDLAEALDIVATRHVRTEWQGVLELEVAARDLEVPDHRRLPHVARGFAPRLHVARQQLEVGHAELLLVVVHAVPRRQARLQYLDHVGPISARDAEAHPRPRREPDPPH